MYCPVCGQEILKFEKACSRCGFSEFREEISDRDEHIKWLKGTVVPYGIRYILSTMSPSEAKWIRLTLGMEDGIKHPDEEVAKMADVCVNRIYQFRAKMIRRLQRLPCQIKLKELENNKEELQFPGEENMTRYGFNDKQETSPVE